MLIIINPIPSNVGGAHCNAVMKSQTFTFPSNNISSDEFYYTSPVKSFEKNDFGLVSFDKKKPVCEQILESLGDLGIDTIVLDKFIKNSILKPLHNHDTSIKSKADYFKKLADSGLFTINDDKVTFNHQALAYSILQFLYTYLASLWAFCRSFL